MKGCSPYIRKDLESRTRRVIRANQAFLRDSVLCELSHRDCFAKEYEVPYWAGNAPIHCMISIKRVLPEGVA